MKSASQLIRTPNKKSNVRVSTEPKEQRLNKFSILDNEFCFPAEQPNLMKSNNNS